MFDFALVPSALTITLQIGAALLAIAFLGGLIAGIFRTITGMEEEIFSLTARACAVASLVYFFSHLGWKQVSDFTLQVWDNSETYFAGN